MIQQGYRWIIGKRRGGFGYHLCRVELVDGIPIYIFDCEPEQYKRAKIEADSHHFIKLNPDGLMETLFNHRIRGILCRLCGGLMYSHEVLRGDTHIGCAQMITTRQGSAKQLDRPFKGLQTLP